MSKKPDGGSAFPSEQTLNPDGLWNQTFDAGMTLREYAAIRLCVPESGSDWLDAIIRAARRDRLAGQAISTAHIDMRNLCGVAQTAYKTAEFMIAESEKEATDAG